MSEELDRVRSALLASDRLVRARAGGRRKGRPAPQVDGREVRRVEVRPVDLKAGPHLQVVSYDDAQAHTANHPLGPAAEAAVDALLAEAFGHWHVETVGETLQARVTKKGAVLVHATERAAPVEVSREHDRAKGRLLPEDAPVLVALGISDHRGRVKPSRQAKYRQVEEFLRLLAGSIDDALEKGRLRVPTPDDPLRVVDLGCGNAYLTFAAHAYLSERLPVRMTGVDVKQQSTDHNAAVAHELGIDADFVVGSIGDVELDRDPDVVLALHACDTATDDALARALAWDAALVLAAPCCHHDIAAQLRVSPAPEPYAALTRDGILRERLADTLTDALRAELLREHGYRVDVVQFVESAHTPRNTLVRAVRVPRAGTGTGPADDADAPSARLADAWGVRPRLADLLAGTR